MGDDRDGSWPGLLRCDPCLRRWRLMWTSVWPSARHWHRQPQVLLLHHHRQGHLLLHHQQLVRGAHDAAAAAEQATAAEKAAEGTEQAVAKAEQAKALEMLLKNLWVARDNQLKI